MEDFESLTAMNSAVNDSSRREVMIGGLGGAKSEARPRASFHPDVNFIALSLDFQEMTYTG